MTFLRGLAPFGLVALFGLSFVQAAPIHVQKRQVGDLQCNVARLEIVSDIFQMKGTVNTLASQVTSDPASAAAVASAQSGIKQAEGAIANIATSIVTGQNASPADRTGVETGLNNVLFGLGNVTSTDPTVQANVQLALSQLQSAAAAGNSVLADCK